MSEKPKRIQLARRRGYRKPEGAVVVARPGRWGNPFLLSDVGWAFPSLTTEQCAQAVVNQLRELIRAGRPITHSVRQEDGSRKPITYTYPSVAEIRRELTGRDLACWCPPDQPCHADVLLEIANSPEESSKPKKGSGGAQLMALGPGAL